ncbi:MAG: FAD-dependent oxidoreductase, partial [Candidatus Scalindua sp.]
MKKMDKKDRKSMGLDLFEKIPLLKTIAKSRWLQFALVFPTFIFFYAFLIAGIFGTPVGPRNVIVVLVWILWWVMLIGIMVPFGSRIWCLVCPFPIFGEWLQRRAFVKVRTGNNIPGLKNQFFGLNKAWPKKLSNIWMQNIGFLFLAMFSPFLVTRPIVSVIVLGGLFVVATILGTIYKHRVFCVHVCPVSGFLGLYAMTSKLSLRAKDPELCYRIKSGEDFVFDDGLAGCTLACPTGIDAGAYVDLVKNRMNKRALEVIQEATPFSGVLGRVCTHPCEKDCLRGKIDEPISICRLKRYIADDVGYEDVPTREFNKVYEEKVAIIGGGPAGLSAAYHLSKKGYETTVYEALPILGGMIRVGIPDYRLPKQVVDKEIAYITAGGVNVITNVTVGKDISFDELNSEYKAIFLATGASESNRLKIKGEDLEGVYNAIDVLRKINLGETVELGDRVIVIGGGDTAIDTARAAIRSGSTDVTVVYRRTLNEMPAISEEISAAQMEGVQIELLTSPVEITGSDGKATALLCSKMQLSEKDASGRPRPTLIKGSEHFISADTIIVATGQYSDIDLLPKELSISSGGTVVVNPDTMATNIPGIFAGGDVVNGPDVLVKALGMGRKAAMTIDKYLRGEEFGDISFYPTEKKVEDEPLLCGVTHSEKRVMSKLLPVNERLRNFNEVEQVFTENMAVREAERCLGCGICGECYRGTEKGWACSWFEKMGAMDRNNYCGLCMECVKSCPHDNIRPYWRPFSGDIAIRGYDEAWKSFIMMMLAVVYPINLLSPWGKIKDWLNFIENGTLGPFLLLSINMFLWCLVIFPAIHYLFCKWSNVLSGVKEVETKELFKKYSYAYVPFGLMAWICFSMPLMMIST